MESKEQFSFAEFREKMHRHIDDAQRLADRNANGMACHLFAEHDKREFDRVFPAALSNLVIAAWNVVDIWARRLPMDHREELLGRAMSVLLNELSTTQTAE